ncbi:uncharacterized protein M421DRAFT_181420 [Didymella exigua CBS 183.55]|uniref:Uncharacterized protein n=1 Tax=Didymella exigua CBS 183.55 TaxID=1150837 RepID=A0A6A5RIK8_9PLEO|nr:uncharacterized protein M421DRAFT_181420 [Didymella exigua CBS 183.55]KAF1927080.1 hypothetical protein M421DRAFT_181420 [Didymella exigua CBS 183.55]
MTDVLEPFRNGASESNILLKWRLRRVRSSIIVRLGNRGRCIAFLFICSFFYHPVLALVTQSLLLYPPRSFMLGNHNSGLVSRRFLLAVYHAQKISRIRDE